MNAFTILVLVSLGLAIAGLIKNNLILIAVACLLTDTALLAFGFKLIEIK